ncbi:MAG: 16S rRNA (uracil(1498)-N(3))-methyltransferase [Alphaproteobacteria bacterium]|uniref:Ribosomal RNA small subunit methyltransferase E n=1 Tax=Candidatus Nitrobium versatile TaxID=2884831 RepID=A0A953J7B7_9BACT|nr:16S rRNA (uracil(1498)-N(3))-methyltransferase [Candidatus Nitrobium versatile]
MTIFIPPDDIAKRKGISLSADTSRYLSSVLRSKTGDPVTVIDGRGRAYAAVVSSLSKGVVAVDITGEIFPDTEPPVPLVLCQGILKGEKMDLVVQKTTELGVREIVPVISERCLVKETRKVKRWQKIAEEAAEQCGRAVIPRIHEPVELLSVPEERGIRGLVFWEQGGMLLREAFAKVKQHCDGAGLPESGPLSPAPFYLLVGPEGGFSREEVERAEARGLVRTTLGRRVLRAETAAIVSVALIVYLSESLQ